VTFSSFAASFIASVSQLILPPSAILSEYLSTHIDIADGTVYPILRKLKSEGILTTYMQEESGGPPRKYYSLTKLGREVYEKERAEYLDFAKKVEALLEDDSDD